MKSFLLVGFVLASQVALAQRFTIKGQVNDSVSHNLSGATVMLLSVSDSSLVNFGVSGAEGFFELRNVERKDYLLKVTFTGYDPYTQRISPPERGTLLELGSIRMDEGRIRLNEVEIQGTVAPVTVKKDTIEFNAAAFRTAKNANVEDLLKKLPGVVVDTDGNITAQGEQVQRITIDGKDFFGGQDPKLATRNLPADAVDKVQVLDRKSDQAVFSGIDDGQRQKAINLELKEEKRHGAFGSAMGGLGTNERFQAKASINRFTKGNQLSFLAMGNNINEQGFGIDEYMNFTGGTRQMASGGPVRIQIDADNSGGVPVNFGNRANGIMSTYGAGASANNVFNKKTELNGSYFFNYLDHATDQSTVRENFLPTGSYTYNAAIKQRNTNANHRANLVLDHNLDSANAIRLTTAMTYTETSTNQQSISENVTPDGVRQNESVRSTLADGTNINLTSNLLYRHRFAVKGRIFSANVQVALTDGDRTGSLDAINRYYTDTPDEEVIQQTNTQQTGYQSYGASLSYTEPLGNRKYLEGNYSFRQNLNQVDKRVYDTDNGEAVLNPQLSSQYNSDYQYHRAGANFRINREKFTLTAGVSWQHSHLQGDLILQNITINKSFENVLPAMRFNYDFSGTRHVRFDYETTVQEPTIQQLQPVVDNSDPINLTVGNPNLGAAYQHNWRLNFVNFNPLSFISFFAFADIDYTTNAITNGQFVDENLVRTTIPVNVKDNLNVNSNATFSFPLTKIKSRLNITGSWRDQRSINLLNDTENHIMQQTVGGNVRYNFRYKEILDLTMGAEWSHQQTQYEFDQPDQTYVNGTYLVESNFTFLKNYMFRTDFQYLNYVSQSTDYHQSIPLLNLSLSRYVLKNKVGELKLSVNNVLDQALGVTQTANVNYIERSVTNSLGRYFMVSFIYSLNKQLNPMGMRGNGPMMRAIR